MSSLSVSDVVVSYRTQRVLHGVSLSVAQGEFVALLGSSGCGKTTLLRAISGFVPVESGSIRVDGRDLTDSPPDKRGMAMVFQSYALWPHMSAAANIGYGLKLRRRPRHEIAARVDGILRLLELQGLGERKATELSGGQRQRVALGRALAIDPAILLLDEPLSNLDARVREQVRHEIKSIQQRLGITAIHVTHDREEAMVMADRIAIMDAGRIVQLGTPEEVFNRPNSPFTASFMGARNVAELLLHREGGEIVVDPGCHGAPARIRLDALPRPEQCPEGSVNVYFRGEAATLVEPDGAGFEGLRLAGAVRQVSYPGGQYRYSVAVGEREYLVDDARRFAVGAQVEVRLPPHALHVFPADGPD
jgi:ABC-type Fe3+/spermidine/putrescine transport system ATPase subunit